MLQLAVVLNWFLSDNASPPFLYLSLLIFSNVNHILGIDESQESLTLDLITVHPVEKKSNPSSVRGLSVFFYMSQTLGLRGAGF